MYAKILTFKKIQHKSATKYWFCITTNHKFIVSGESEEEILEKAGELIYNRESYLPQRSKITTVHVEIINVELKNI